MKEQKNDLEHEKYIHWYPPVKDKSKNELFCFKTIGSVISEGALVLTLYNKLK